MLTRFSLTIPLFVFLIVAAACTSIEPVAPTPTASPTEFVAEPTPSPQPSKTPTATEIPLPTPTETLPPLTGGGELIFSSERDGNPEIYTMNLDGSEQRRLTDNPERDGYPAWSPDGSRIAFYAYHGATWSIHMMDADGGNRGRLTEVSGARHNAPAWSPDGTRIAFASDQGIRHEIWLMRPDGSEQRKIDSVSGGGPAWSPDGDQIAYHSTPLDQAEITVMNPDGSEQLPLTDNDAQDWWPDWSPDGSQIAFMSDRDGDFEIYVMDVHDSTKQKRLTFNDGDDWRPRWSPDGTRIAFVSMRDGNYELYIINPDGSDQQRLTDNGFSDIQVAWRPLAGALSSAGPVMSPTMTPAAAIPFSFDTIRDIPYQPDGHAKHELDLYRPDGEGGPSPVLLALHGGRGDKSEMAGLATHFAELGYAVVSANFRESPQSKYPGPVQDAFCALAWIHANADTHNLDPDRIFALGFSLGGTFAAMLGTVDDPSLYMQECPHSLPSSNWVQGVVTFTGVFDLAGSSGPLLAYYVDYVGALPEEDPTLWAEASPVGWLDGREPPFLLIHGELDGNIDPSHSAGFAAALEKAAVPVGLLIIPGKGHMTLIRSEQAFDAVEIFMARTEP